MNANVRIKELELELDADFTSIKGFVVELFLLEMEKLREMQTNAPEEPTYILCNGNSGRNSNKDVMKIRRLSHLVEFTYETLYTIILRRNGIYHSLPEALFHPLALGTVYSSVDDIVSSIRKNQRDTIDCKQFFSLFDNKFLEYKSQLLKRELEWPYNNELYTPVLVKDLLGINVELTQKQAILLLSTVQFHQDIKSSYKLQASLLTMLIDSKVTIAEYRHAYMQTPFGGMGTTALGIDAGLSGPCYDELNDLEISIWVTKPEEIEQNILDKSQEKFVLEIMTLFNLSTRQIFIKYQIEKDYTETYLGKKGYLGLNTSLA